MNFIPLRTTEIGVYVAADRVVVHAPATADFRSRTMVQGSFPMPAGGWVGNLPKASSVVPLLRRWLRENGLRPRRIRLVYDFPQTRFRALRLPAMPESDRVAVIRGELELLAGDQFPIAAFDYLWIESPSTEQGRRDADVAAFFLTESELSEFEQICTGVGAILEGVEPATLAAIRSTLAELPAEPVAVLNGEGDACDLVLSDGEEVRVVRRIPGGLRGTDRATGSVVGVSDDAPDIPGFAASAQVAPLGFDSASGVRFVASEVSRTLAFFARSIPDIAPIRTVHVLGLPGDPERLAAAGDGVGLEWVPVADIGNPEPAADTGFTAARGTTIAELPHRFRALSLKRQERQARMRRRAPIFVRLAVTASILVIISAVYSTLTISMDEDRAIRGKLDETTRIEELSRRRGDRLRRQAVVDAARVLERDAALPVPELLGRLAAATTAGVSVGRFEIRKDGTVKIEGDAVGARNIEQFADAMGRRGRFSDLAFDSLRQAKEGTISYEIVARYRSKEEGTP